MFEEYDSVMLVAECNDVPLPVGSGGAIVLVHDARAAVYEVEFFDDEGTTIGVHTVDGCCLARRDAAGRQVR